MLSFYFFLPIMPILYYKTCGLGHLFEVCDVLGVTSGTAPASVNFSSALPLERVSRASVSQKTFKMLSGGFRTIGTSILRLFPPNLTSC